MEGNKVYQDSYNAVKKAIKDNSTGKLIIDYSKFDERTASEVRIAIRNVLQKRQSELWQILSGVQ